MMTFYHLIRQRKQRRRDAIRTINSPDGQIHTKQHTILKCIQSQFSNIFASSKVRPVPSNDIQANIKQSVTEEDKVKLDENITMEELETILKSSHTHRSPGKDGLTVEFYNRFWLTIKSTIILTIKLTIILTINIFNQMFQLNKLRSDQKLGSHHKSKKFKTNI